MLSELEKWGIKKRLELYMPLLSLLQKFSCTPNGITTFRMLLVVPFYFIFLYDQVYGIFFYFFILFLDTVDGTYARFLKKACDRNKFFDMFADHIVHSSLVIALLSTARVDPLMAAIYLVLLPSVSLLSAIYKFENKSSDWVIHPRAERSFYKIFIISMVVLDQFVKTLLLPWAFLLSNCVLVVDGGLLYTRLMLRTQKKKEHY